MSGNDRGAQTLSVESCDARLDSPFHGSADLKLKAQLQNRGGC